MIRERLALIVENEIGLPPRRFLSNALAVVAAGLLLQIATALAAESPSSKAELLIGAATADITPQLPAALTGFQTVRITRTIQSPLTANVLALESRQGERTMDQAILVSCDLCVIRPGIQEGFRKHVADRLIGFDVGKLFLAATHTHSAPVLKQDQYDEKQYGEATQPKERTCAYSDSVLLRATSAPTCRIARRVKLAWTGFAACRGPRSWGAESPRRSSTSPT